jgi:2-phosphoglycerate kinase
MAATEFSATPDDLDGGFAYVRGRMEQWLMATGLEPEPAWNLARRIEGGLNGSGRVSLDALRSRAREVLGPRLGDRTAERFCRWHEFLARGRPLVVLIGGGSGVGKSTVATELARHLGITHVSSTDFIRQILRSVVPDTIAPELARSSFELDQGDGAAVHAEFERQAHQVLVGVRATIERATREGTPLIVEGIHLCPGMLDVHAVRDGVVVAVVLTLGNGDAHAERFERRAAASERPAERYEDGLDAIRELQDHLVACARVNEVPVVENCRLDATVGRMLDLVFAAIAR